ncbi:type II secretion system F family protein [Glycomyces buryatensis]|uniref:Type II secretion system F family protein n=1 Tax=Glycomyces buryatensis TaxID=2570927 RepID=A0A4S8PVR9_9ACTN|nr:type II secretion system F family protein [Glycomyces buryatensis]THV35683.1 type II secretion system F family protein [Glycomyces buryatensis]
MSTVQTALALGAVFGLGTVIAALGLRNRPTVAAQYTARRSWLREHWKRLLAALAAATAAGLFTGWPVAALAAGALAWFAPRLFGSEQTGRAEIERIDAIAAWIESLRDVLAAAAGLEQTITATAAYAPPRIRAEVAALADDLHAGRSLSDALADFARAVDDETADMAVMALSAAANQSGNLSDLLSRLARTAREGAAVRMRIQASRARVRTASRIMAAVALIFPAGLIVLNRDFLAPYGNATGQMVLALVVGIYALALWWLASLSAPARAVRLLGGSTA